MTRKTFNRSVVKTKSCFRIIKDSPPFYGRAEVNLFLYRYLMKEPSPLNC